MNVLEMEVVTDSVTCHAPWLHSSDNTSEITVRLLWVNPEYIAQDRQIRDLVSNNLIHVTQFKTHFIRVPHNFSEENP